MLVLLALLALSTPPRTVTAAPAGEVAIDGVLDEDAWAAAEVATDFVQFEPTEGAPASERTEVRVLRGADALVIGARMWARDPSQIRTTLSRRDDDGDADAFLVSLDSYDDGRTAYQFGVTAAGVQFDAILEGRRDDESWDAVWASAARVDAQGWTAEIRIPYSQLRFSEASPSWGVQFLRVIPSQGEESYWAPVTRAETGGGLVRLFGRLDGLGGIAPRSVLQVRPYTLAGGSRAEDPDRPGRGVAEPEGNLGADLKLGLGPSLILDATVNPDFGQVEADPAELNLGTFETVFQERRPFFVEGTQIFDLTIGGGDGSLLYSRRIGGASPIIAATKLTGRTASGLSFGALGSATGRRFDPTRFYLATRLKQELPGQSYVGAGLTAFGARADDDRGLASARSVAAAGDWGLRFAGGSWLFEGTAAAALRASGDDTRLGAATYVGLDKIAGYVEPGFGLRLYSADFRLNDVGRFRQTDVAQARAGTRVLWNEGQPVGPFRRVRSGVFGTQTWTLSDQASQGFQAFASTSVETRSFQEFDLSVRVSDLGGVNVRETRGLGPVRNVPFLYVDLDAESDSRRRLRLAGSVGAGVEEGGGQTVNLGAAASWAVSDRFSLDVDAEVGSGTGRRAWAANESVFVRDGGLSIGASAGAPEAFTEADLVGLGSDVGLLDGVAPYAPAGLLGTPYYLALFGARDTREVDVTTRAQVIFGPSLSLQLYGQLFAARGRYRDFSILAGPDDLRPVDGFPKRRDFSVASFTANAVLRWEYRPGSTLFVVWSQGREDDRFEETLLDGAGPSPFDVGTGRQLFDTFDAFPEDVVLVKLSYLLMR